jgi:hypothetical protein
MGWIINSLSLFQDMNVNEMSMGINDVHGDACLSSSMFNGLIGY